MIKREESERETAKSKTEKEKGRERERERIEREEAKCIHNSIGDELIGSQIEEIFRPILSIALSQNWFYQSR